MKKFLIFGLAGMLFVGGTGSLLAYAQNTSPEIPSWKFSKNLHFGMRGSSEVSGLQEFLTDQGYYSGPVTGNYFFLTTQAVRKFQSAQGITPTGYFGAKSRGSANAILEKLIDVICPEEEGCVPDELPAPQLSISTESPLSAPLGESFMATFRVRGGDGHYAIHADGKIPGLHFTRNECPKGVNCIKGEDPDTITLTGVPEQAGVFSFAILARDPETKSYGRASFALIVRGVKGSAPVIQGVKGPLSLRAGEQGMWTVNTSAKSGQNLSYFVSWGDDSGFANGLAAPDRAPLRVSQTATFSHFYVRPGTYTALFRVVNEQGLSAETSLSVQVTGEIEQVGYLEIQPSSLSLAVGGSATLAALYQPPMPPCPSGMACAMLMPAPYPVAVSWSVADPRIARINAYRCAVSELDVNQGLCFQGVAQVQAIASGKTAVTATYRLSSGGEVKAHAAVEVAAQSTGIIYSASTNKSSYRSDEKIEITITARNTASRAETLNFTSGCQAAYAIRWNSTVANSTVYEYKNTMVCTKVFTSVTLAPGEAKTWTFVHTPETSRLPSGEYRVVGEVIGYGSASAGITVY